MEKVLFDKIVDKARGSFSEDDLRGIKEITLAVNYKRFKSKKRKFITFRVTDDNYD